jgi:DNA-binding transcriptional MerR regulator
MPNTPPPHLRAALQQGEAADLIGVTPRTLRNWRKSGFGPTPVRDGCRLLYDRAEVSAFMAGAR